MYSYDTSPILTIHSAIPCKPKHVPKFILDVHLGGLASFLRIMGFDTSYQKFDRGDAAIAKIAHSEGRVVLTRDIGLLKRAMVKYGYWLRNIQPEKQIIEVMRRYSLKSHIYPWRFRFRCNCTPLLFPDCVKILRNSPCYYSQFCLAMEQNGRTLNA